MAQTFAYKARDHTGQVKSGVVLAEDMAAAAAYVRGKGYFVTRIRPWREPFSLRALWVDWQPVPVKDLALLCRQFATLVDAGLSLITCLGVLREQTSNSRVRRALADVYKQVQEGRSLSGALAGHPHVFPSLLVSMVEAGELGGMLDVVLRRLAVHLEKEHKLNEKVKAALTYPAVVLAMASLAVTFIITFVLPTFVQLYQGATAALPWPTRILLGVSGFLRQWGLYMAAAILAVAYGLVLWCRQPAAQQWLEGVLLHTPVFGTLWRKTVIARFSRTLGTLLRGGVPLLAALDVVARASGSQRLALVAATAQRSVLEGRGLAGSLGAAALFAPMVMQLVAVGEEAGELDAMLEKVADFYESDVEDMTSRLSSMLEPLLILVLGGIIGAILIAVVLPMFDVVANFQAG